MVLTVLAGLMQAFSLSTPWDGQPLWWLQTLALTGFAWLLLQTSNPGRAAALGWLFATSWLTATFGWLFTSMHTYGGLAAPLALLAVLGLAGFLALYWAVACAGFTLLFRDQAIENGWGSAIVFSALWLLAELARTVWFTGFPWGGIAYAHIDGPLAAYAPWVGGYGMTLVAAATAMGLAQALQQAQVRRSGLPPLGPLASVLFVAALLPWGLRSAHAEREANPSLSTGTVTLALLQGNIPQDEKFESGTGVAMALQWYSQELRAAHADLVVAPETALPLLPQDMPEGYWAALQTHFGHASAALIGTPLGSLAEGYTNSVYGLAPGLAAPYRYDKHHLVPFGEFIPPLFRWFTEMMDIPLGDFERGSVNAPSFPVRGERVALNICYEDLFGEELAVRFADAATAPTVLANISNIGWFGNTIAITQHLNISRLRTLELQRPMLRATNTGATAIIDHQGRVTAQLPPFTRGALQGQVQGRRGNTVYADWASRWGLWPLVGLACLVVLLALGLSAASKKGMPRKLARSP